MNDLELIEKILPFSELMLCRKNEDVVVKGTKSRYFYYVQKGTIEVSYTAGTTKIVVAIIGAGSFFGEIGYFDGVSRVRDIKATQDSEICVFDYEMIQKLQRENPVLYGKFMAFMAKSICAKFRRILQDQEPLTGYAASLSAGKRKLTYAQPVPEKFLQTTQWRNLNKFIEEFKATLFDLSYKLQKDSSPYISELLEKECNDILYKFNDDIQNVKDYIRNPEDEELIWGYIFKEAYPYFMRSRFAERTYFKPKGYAGDFMMMEMIYHNRPDGDGKLGLLVDKWLLQSPSSKAVRERRRFLSAKLKLLTLEKIEQNETINIMNVACGSNRELCDFLAQCEYSDKIKAICVDIDSEALQYSDSIIKSFPHKASIKLMKENLIKWALGSTRQEFGLQDIIYSAGLADYLNDKLFVSLITRCYKHLKPGGVLIIGNFAPNSDEIFMDNIMQWPLIYRSEDKFKQLFAESPFGQNIEITYEAQKVTVFAIATKES